MSREGETTSSVTAKQQHICETLRRQIVQGSLAPGARLPTQVQLVELFQVSGVTVQRALDRLMREGFICTRGRQGTFVTDRPPHLSNFGLVFVDQPVKGKHRSRYHEMLEQQAFRLQQEGDRQITVFNGISGHEDEEAFRQLVADVRAHRMAGLMLVDPDPLEGTAILEEPGIPRVAIMSYKIEPRGCPVVCPDLEGMVDLGLDALIEQGRKRIAVLTTVPLYLLLRQYLREAVKGRSITVHERWLQIVPHELPDATRNNVLMLMHPGGDERPDGIFVLDDNLAESASSGLVETGTRVPQDVAVVSHCNFPWLTPSVLPVQRVGFDTQQILAEALRVIDLQRQGQTPPPITLVKAVLQPASQQVW